MSLETAPAGGDYQRAAGGRDDQPVPLRPDGGPVPGAPPAPLRPAQGDGGAGDVALLLEGRRHPRGPAGVCLLWNPGIDCSAAAVLVCMSIKILASAAEAAADASVPVPVACMFLHFQQSGELSKRALCIVLVVDSFLYPSACSGCTASRSRRRTC